MFRTAGFRIQYCVLRQTHLRDFSTILRCPTFQPFTVEYRNHDRFTLSSNINYSQARFMSKHSKSTKKGKNVVDKIVEDLVDDEDEDNDDGVIVDQQNSQLNKFLSSKTPGGGKKGTKGNIHKMPYSEFIEIVKGEKLWSQMNKTLEGLKLYYIQQLTVRSSTSLDELEIELEGDIYPLNELAAISKKDPKRLIIDVSAFPQAIKNVMSAIRDSGLNLNPQQEGFTIYVPIPKVTKEHREHLAEGAKKKLNEFKADLRKVQTSAQRRVGEDELADKITKEDAKSAQETIKLIADHFQAQGEVMLVNKTKDLLGK